MEDFDHYCHFRAVHRDHRSIENDFTQGVQSFRNGPCPFYSSSVHSHSSEVQSHQHHFRAISGVIPDQSKAILDGVRKLFWSSLKSTGAIAQRFTALLGSFQNQQRQVQRFLEEFNECIQLFRIRSGLLELSSEAFQIILKSFQSSPG